MMKKEWTRRYFLEYLAGNGSMPSIQSAAEDLGVSKSLVQQVLRQMVQEKILIGIQGKGYFAPGNIPTSGSNPPNKERNLRLEELKNEVLHSYDPGEKLPSLKELAENFNLDFRVIRDFFYNSDLRGEVERKGRFFYRKMTPKPRSGTVVWVVYAEEPERGVHFRTEREVELYKWVYHSAGEMGLKLELYAYNDRLEGSNQEKFAAWLAQKQKGELLLGILLSSGHFAQVQKLVHLLESQHLPLSVFKESPIELKKGKGKKRVVVFDLAYGDLHGKRMARGLEFVEAREFCFISPFHKAQWSREREAGILGELGRQNKSLHSFTLGDFVSEWEFGDALIEPQKRQTYEQRKIADLKLVEKQKRNLMKVCRPLFQEAYSRFSKMPWITGNDLTAQLVVEFCEENGLGCPEIFSFDSTVASFDLNFHSYRFRIEQLAKEMLWNVVSDRFGPGLHKVSIPGELVLKPR